MRASPRRFLVFAFVTAVGVADAYAQERDHCDWCGCKGGPGYRVGARVEPRNRRMIGKCVGHRDLTIVRGTPPTTDCTYEGNREHPGRTRDPGADGIGEGP